LTNYFKPANTYTLLVKWYSSTESLSDVVGRWIKQFHYCIKSVFTNCTYRSRESVFDRATLRVERSNVRNPLRRDSSDLSIPDPWPKHRSVKLVPGFCTVSSGGRGVFNHPILEVGSSMGRAVFLSRLRACLGCNVETSLFNHKYSVNMYKTTIIIFFLLHFLLFFLHAYFLVAFLKLFTSLTYIDFSLMTCDAIWSRRNTVRLRSGSLPPSSLLNKLILNGSSTFVWKKIRDFYQATTTNLRTSTLSIWI
jgi:hypothetical protein